MSAGMLPLFALSLALSLAVQGAMLALPLLTMHVYDGVLVSRNQDTLLALGLAYAAAVLLGGVLRLQRALLFGAMAERLSRRLQLRALAAAVRVAIGGDRLRGLTALADIAEVRRLLGGSTATDLFDLAAIPAALAMLWLLHPYYGAAGLAGCVLLGVLGAASDRATRSLVREAGRLQTQTASDLSGRLRQRDLVEGLGLLNPVLRRWQAQQARALEAQDAAQRRARALQGLAAFATQAMQIGTVALGAWLVVTHRASPGSILAASLLIGMATAPGARLVATWRDWAYGLVAWRRLHALLAATAPPSPVPPLAGAPAGLLVERLTCLVPGSKRALVAELELHLPPGQVLAVVGPNGAGKTSLLRTLLGLQAPAAGRALLDGQDTLQSDRGALGPAIGYLPQGGQLLAGSVLDNIGRFAGGPAEAAITAARRAGAHEMIGRLPDGYAAGAGPAAGLSGGQRQLIALARALYGAPRLLVLDEPEAGLDAAGRTALRRAVAAAKRGGAAVLLVTHQPDAWGALLDRKLSLLPGGAWRDTAATPPEEIAA